MLLKMYGDDAMDEMDADRQTYEDQAEYNAARPDRHIVLTALPGTFSKTPILERALQDAGIEGVTITTLDSIPF